MHSHVDALLFVHAHIDTLASRLCGEAGTQARERRRANAGNALNLFGRDRDDGFHDSGGQPQSVDIQLFAHGAILSAD